MTLNTYLQILLVNPFKFKFYFDLKYFLNLNSKINVHCKTVGLKPVHAINLFIIPFKNSTLYTIPNGLDGVVAFELSNNFKDWE